MKIKHIVRSLICVIVAILFFLPVCAFATSTANIINSVHPWVWGAIIIILLLGTIFSAMGVKGYNNKKDK